MKAKRLFAFLFVMPFLSSCSFINNIKEKLFPSKDEKPERIEITDNEERNKVVKEIKAAINRTLTADSYKITLEIPILMNVRLELAIDGIHQNYIAEGYREGEKQSVAYGEMYEGKLAIYNQSTSDASWHCVEYEQEEFFTDSMIGLTFQSSSMEDELSENIRLFKEGDFYIQSIGGTKDALIEAYKLDPQYDEKIAPVVESLEDFQLIIGIKDGYYVYEEYKMSYLRPEYDDNNELVSIKAENTSLYVGAFTEINNISVSRPEGVIVPPVVEKEEPGKEEDATNAEPGNQPTDSNGNSGSGSSSGTGECSAEEEQPDSEAPQN